MAGRMSLNLFCYSSPRLSPPKPSDSNTKLTSLSPFPTSFQQHVWEQTMEAYHLLSLLCSSLGHDSFDFPPHSCRILIYRSTFIPEASKRFCFFSRITLLHPEPLFVVLLHISHQSATLSCENTTSLSLRHQNIT